MVDLSVIIVNYNVRYFLELCLSSVFDATKFINTEVIVVDNNSKDDSCEMVRAKFPSVVLINNKENIGFSKANNIGVSKAKGEFLCILNPDTIVAEDTFYKLFEFSKAKKNLGIVSCKLIDGAGNYLPESKRNVPNREIALKKLLGFSKCYYVSELNNESIGKVPVFVGAFMFLKREVYLKVGGFDERYFMYGEDIDFSYSVLNEGYENYYFGKTAIIHFKGESTLKDNEYAKRFYGAMKLFYNKYYNSNFLFDIIVSLGIKILPFIYLFTKTKNPPYRTEKKVCNSDFSFKEIIELIEKQDFYYSISLENTNFTISSKSSKTKGFVFFDS